MEDKPRKNIHDLIGKGQQAVNTDKIKQDLEEYRKFLKANQQRPKSVVTKSTITQSTQIKRVGVNRPIDQNQKLQRRAIQTSTFKTPTAPISAKPAVKTQQPKQLTAEQELRKYQSVANQRKKMSTLKKVMIGLTATMAVVGLSVGGMLYLNNRRGAYFKTTLDYNLDDLDTIVKLKKGEAIKDIYVQQIDNHRFDGWYADEQYTQPLSPNTKITEKITIYGKYVKTTDVIVNIDGTGKTVTLDLESPITDIEIEQRVGYRFDGWYRDLEYTNKFEDDYKFLTDTTIYGKYIKITNVDINIDGEIVESKVVDADTLISEMEIEAKEDYRFDGWYSDAEYQNKLEDTHSFDEDIVIYGRYIQQLTITIVTDEEEFEKIVDKGTTIKQLQEFMESNNYICNAWYSDEEKTNQLLVEHEVTDGALYGDFIKKLYVTINVEDYSTGFYVERHTTAQQIYEIANLNKINSETTCGWFTDSELKNVLTEVTQDVTLYTRLATLDKLLFTEVDDEVKVSAPSGWGLTGKVVIPNTYNGKPVTTVGGFDANGGITDVVLSTNVTDLDTYCFYGCGISSINLTSALKRIAPYALGEVQQELDISGCVNLVEADLSGKMLPEHINFSNCTNLKEINLSGTNVKSVKLNNCENLTYINLSNTEINNIDLSASTSMTRIGYKAFENCTNLTSIKLPATITTINESAFEGCYALAEIYNPSPTLSLTIGGDDNGQIAKYAKVIHTSLDESTRMQTIDNIQYYAHDETFIAITATNNNVENVTFDSKTTSINANAFLNYNNLKTVDLSGCDNLTNIGSSAFYSCVNLVSVKLSTSLTSIENYAFNYCRSLISINLPNSLTSIGDSAFNDCKELISINLSSNLISIGSSAFYNCSKLTGNLCFPQDVNNIGQYAFYGCSNLDSVDLSSCANLTSLPYSIFNSCDNLTSITLPSTLTIIGKYAFAGCSEIVNITLPATLETIEQYAFSACYRLTEVYNFSNLSISVGGSDNGLVAYYALAVYKENVESKIQTIDGVNYYINEGKNEFIAIGLTDKKLKTILLDDSTTEIKKNAFESYALTDIDFSKCQNLTTIGSYAFAYTKISSLNLNGLNRLKTIKDNAFRYCANLTTVNLTQCPNLISIEDEAFYDCTGLTSINLSGCLKFEGLGDRQFVGCSGLSNVDMSECASLNYIGLGGCTNLNTIKLSGCTNLTEVYLRECTGLTSIDLSSCISLQDIDLGQCSSLVSVDFSDCVALAKIDLRYTNLKSLDLSMLNNLTTISSYAFAGSSLTSIKLPANLTNIEDYAFENCYALVEIYNFSSLPITVGSDDYGNVAKYAKVVYSPTESLTAESKIQLVNNVYYYINGEDVVAIATANKDIITLSLDSKTTEINPNAFNNCDNLISINLSNCANLTTIGSYAFYGCNNLTSVNLTGCTKLTTIGDYTFYYCFDLTKLDLSNCQNLTTIGMYAFGESGITIIKLPSSLTSIDEHAFYRSDLTTIDLSTMALTRIENGMFSGCGSLTSIKLPNNLISIEEFAFVDCNKLTSITLPSSLLTIEDNAFYNCYSLETIYNYSCLDIQAGRNRLYGKIGEYAENVYTDSSKWFTSNGVKYFKLTENTYVASFVSYLTTSITLIEGTERIGSEAFAWCDNLTTVTLPTTLKVIGYKAFDNYYSQVASIDLSGCTNLTTIEKEAFMGFGNLTTIKLPNSLTTIEEGAFYACYSLIEVYNLSNLPITAGSEKYGHVGYYAAMIYTSLDEQGTIETINNVKYYVYGDEFIAIDTTSEYAGNLILDSRTTAIKSYAFSGYRNSIDLSNCTNLVSIGAYAFNGCDGLSILNLSACEKLTSIGDNAFGYCYYLQSVDLSGCNNLITIGKNAFDNNGNGKLNSVTLPKGDWYVTKYDDYTGGKLVDTSKPSENDNYLRYTYLEYYWYKVESVSE